MQEYDKGQAVVSRLPHDRDGDVLPYGCRSRPIQLDGNLKHIFHDGGFAGAAAVVGACAKRHTQGQLAPERGKWFERTHQAAIVAQWVSLAKRRPRRRMAHGGVHA